MQCGLISTPSVARFWLQELAAEKHHCKCLDHTVPPPRVLAQPPEGMAGEEPPAIDIPELCRLNGF
jgi:hypothetical protein